MSAIPDNRSPGQSSGDTKSSVASTADRAVDKGADKAHAAIDSTKDTLHSGVRKADDVVDHARDKAEDAVGQVQQKAGNVANKVANNPQVSDMTRQFEEQLRENPARTLLLAIGAGFLLGRSMK